MLLESKGNCQILRNYTRRAIHYRSCHTRRVWFARLGYKWQRLIRMSSKMLCDEELNSDIFCRKKKIFERNATCSNRFRRFRWDEWKKNLECFAEIKYEISHDAHNKPSHFHVIAYLSYVLGIMISKQNETNWEMREVQVAYLRYFRIVCKDLICFRAIWSIRIAIYLSFLQMNNIKLALSNKISNSIVKDL
jgi:hypothetical protein